MDLELWGGPMAKNLIKAGHELVVCDFNKSAVDDLVPAAQRLRQTALKLPRSAMLSLPWFPTPPHVRAACLGEGGIIETGK